MNVEKIAIRAIFHYLRKNRLSATGKEINAIEGLENVNVCVPEKTDSNVSMKEASASKINKD